MTTAPYLANLVINWALRAQTPTAPTGLYLALFSDDPTVSLDTELVFDDYARQTLTLTAPVGGRSFNNADVSFGTTTSGWGAITHYGVFDALTSGHLLISEAFDEPFTDASGSTIVVLAGTLEIVLE